MSARSLFLLLPLALATACSSAEMSGAADSLGVTPGGSQDIGYVRDLIEDGYIPDADSFTAEGLFSEHDLPLDGDACSELLCPDSAASTLPLDDAMVVQLGFSTSITEDGFERRPLNMGVAVDISGSMSDGKLDSVQVALHEMVDQLDASDRLALVAFDDEAELLLAGTVMDEAGKDKLRRAIDRLHTAGGTNIEAGMKLAYEQVAPLAAAAGVEDRVMLFTDAMPNVDATDIDSFVGMAGYYGAAGIGLTVFGTGLDLGAELAATVSQVRGGNYVYLPDNDEISHIFDEAFEYVVSPIAYDLEVQVEAAEGWRFIDAVGAPLLEEGPRVDFGAGTLFLSNNDGGIAVMMAREGGSPLADEGEALADFALRYEDAYTGDIVQDSLAVSFQGGSAFTSDSLGAASPLADALGPYKMAFLLDELAALSAGADFCAGKVEQEQALATVDLARERLATVAEELPDERLAEEAQLMHQLIENIRAGRDRCWRSS